MRESNRRMGRVWATTAVAALCALGLAMRGEVGGGRSVGGTGRDVSILLGRDKSRGARTSWEESGGGDRRDWGDGEQGRTGAVDVNILARQVAALSKAVGRMSGEMSRLEGGLEKESGRRGESGTVVRGQRRVESERRSETGERAGWTADRRAHVSSAWMHGGISNSRRGEEEEEEEEEEEQQQESVEKRRGRGQEDRSLERRNSGQVDSAGEYWAPDGSDPSIGGEAGLRSVSHYDTAYLGFGQSDDSNSYYRAMQGRGGGPTPCIWPNCVTRSSQNDNYKLERARLTVDPTQQSSSSWSMPASPDSNGDEHDEDGGRNPSLSSTVERLEKEKRMEEERGQEKEERWQHQPRAISRKHDHTSEAQRQLRQAQQTLKGQLEEAAQSHTVDDTQARVPRAGFALKPKMTAKGGQRRGVAATVGKKNGGGPLPGSFVVSDISPTSPEPVSPVQHQGNGKARKQDDAGDGKESQVAAVDAPTADKEHAHEAHAASRSAANGLESSSSPRLPADTGGSDEPQGYEGFATLRRLVSSGGGLSNATVAELMTTEAKMMKKLEAENRLKAKKSAERAPKPAAPPVVLPAVKPSAKFAYYLGSMGTRNKLVDSAPIRRGAMDIQTVGSYYDAALPKGTRDTQRTPMQPPSELRKDFKSRMADLVLGESSKRKKGVPVLASLARGINGFLDKKQSPGRLLDESQRPEWSNGGRTPPWAKHPGSSPGGGAQEQGAPSRRESREEAQSYRRESREEAQSYRRESREEAQPSRSRGLGEVQHRFAPSRSYFDHESLASTPLIESRARDDPLNANDRYNEAADQELAAKERSFRQLEKSFKNHLKDY